MIPRLQLNGTEGTASCRVTVVNETNGGENMKPHLQGCIVSSKDENLKDLIGLWKNPSDDQNIFSKHKYFFYSPNGEIITKQMKTTVSYPKTGDSTHHEKQYELERNLNAVVVNKSHSFLLCESEELDKCSFLKKHRINGIRLNQTLGNEVYGLGNYEDHFSFIKLKIEKCKDQPSTNEYKVQNLSDEQFKNLLDVPGPIIIVDEKEGKTKKRKERIKTLVGSFVKVTGKSHRISCSVFEVPGRTTDRLGTSSLCRSKVDGDSDSEKGGNEPSENAENVDGINPKSDTAKVNSSLEDVDDEIKNDDRGKNMKETSKFSSSNSYVWREVEFIQRKRQLNEKLEESNKQLEKYQLNEKLEENKRQLQKQLNEKQEEDKRQLQKQLNEKQEEDKRQLQKQLNEKQEEDKRQLQKQLNEKQEEDKRQLQKQLNEKQEEDKRQLQKQLNEKQEENKRQVQQLNEKQEENKRQLQKQLNEKQEEDKRQLQKQLNEKQEEDKRQLQKQLNEKQEEDKRQLQKQLNEKQEENKRQVQQLDEKQEENKRQLQKQLNEKQEEDKRQLQQKNERLEEDKRQLQQKNERLEEDKRQLQIQLNEKLEEDKSQLQLKNEKLEEDKRKLEMFLIPFAIYITITQVLFFGILAYFIFHKNGQNP